MALSTLKSTADMEQKINKGKIKSKLTYMKSRLTESDISNILDNLAEKIETLTMDTLKEFDDIKGIRKKLIELLDIIFKANACGEFLCILRTLGFEDVVNEIETSDIQCEGRYSRSQTYDVLPAGEEPMSVAKNDPPAVEKDSSELVSKISSLEETVAAMSEVLKTTHINTSEMKKTTEEMKESLKQLQDREPPSTSLIANYEKELEELKTTMADLTGHLETQKDKFLNLQTAYKGLKKQLQEKHERLTTLTRKNSEMENIKLKNLILNKEITNMDIKQQRLSEDIVAKDETLRAGRETHARDVNVLQREIANLQDDLKTNMSEKGTMEVDLQEQHRITQGLEDTLEKKHFEILKLQNKIKELLTPSKHEKGDVVKGKKMTITPKPTNVSKRSKRIH